jgi:hypothetical protein
MTRRTAATAETQAPLLRTYRRFTPGELAGLRTARVKWGSEISVVDLSVGGVRFEIPGELAPGSTVALEFLSPTRTVLRTARILRCQRARSVETSEHSVAACVFRRPFPVSSFVSETLPGGPAALTTREDTRAWRQVVGKYRDGRLIRGYTNDFSPSSPYLHISPAPYAEGSAFVSMINLDALFFGRDAPPINGEDAEPSGPDVVPAGGRKVAVPLPNGTEMIGSARSYTRSSRGFFVESLDGDSGTLRVFVTAGGVRSIRFVEAEGGTASAEAAR